MAESDSIEPAPRRWPGAFILRLDLRSLALVRIAYGVILFLDTVVRWTDLEAHYSDFGVLPRDKLVELGWNEYWFSLHMASGHEFWLNLLFLLQAVAALALLVGFRTRLATLLSWLLLISLHSRNPMVLNGGDIYLRVFLFWMLFLPWGHRWSWDAKRASGDHVSGMPGINDAGVHSAAALAVLVQIASVYWFAALPKTDPSWTADYTATQLALGLDQFATPLGIYFREHLTGLLPWMTYFVVFWEFYGAFLLFFPFDRGETRTVAVFGFTAMHAGFGSMMELGFFAWIGAVTPLSLLPAWFWNRPAARPARWLDAKFGAGPDATGHAAVAYAREVVFIWIIVYCFAWNLGNENARPNWLRVPHRLLWIGHALRLDQRWNMFSPKPLLEDGWYVIEGRFKHGAVLDLFKEGGGELSWAKPARVARTYRTQRWRRFMMNLWMADNEKYRLPYGQYLCRKWNRKGRGPDELSGFEIVYMLEMTNLDGTEAAPEKRVIWKHWCFEPPASEEVKSD